MFDFKTLLEKYANDLTSWENSLDDEDKKQRDLIRKSQNGDFLAYKQLKSSYQNIINKSISDAGLTSVMDFTTAQQEGSKAFRELIMKNFDLNKKVKPKTYIIGTLPLMLKKVKYDERDFAARKSRDLTMQSEVVSTAKNFLKQELGRNPSLSETYTFIKNNMSTGKSIDTNKIKKVEAYERRELSGNQQIGEETQADGAEYLTLQDITNVSDITPEQMYEANMKNQAIESVINKLPRMERRFIRSFYGIGEFKNKKANSLHQAALNNNMSYYEAQKTVSKFKKMLKDEGLI